MTLSRLLVAALVAAPLSLHGQEPDSTGQSATVSVAPLPLDEVLRLYRENEAAQKPPESQPPLPASVDRVECVARLLDDAASITARVQVSVLEEQRWVSVDVLDIGDDGALTALPNLENATLAVRGRRLAFVSKTAGRHVFEVTLSKRARADGRRRQASLTLVAPALATLSTEFDPSAFALLDGGRNQTVATPVDDRFELAWRVLGDPAAVRAVAADAPASESVVQAVRASIVSGLDGHRTARLLYELRYGGESTFELRVPAGQTLERLYANGASLPFTVRDERVVVEARPSRAGVATGSLEAVLTEERGVYSLSGHLSYELPAVSWPIHEVTVDIFEPPVFNFAWRGGSLSPHGEPAPGAAYRYAIPTPGKRLGFRQLLVQSTAPTLRLDYAVDLTGQYYRPDGSGRPAAARDQSPE